MLEEAMIWTNMTFEISLEFRNLVFHFWYVII